MSIQQSHLGIQNWCWSWSSNTLATWCEEVLIRKDPDAGKDWGQEEKGMTEDGMAGWHHWLDGREFKWTQGVGDGQGGLVCCDSWGRKESDTTEWLNWTEGGKNLCSENTKFHWKKSKRTLMEKYTVFMDWKNQCSENEYNAQSNL